MRRVNRLGALAVTLALGVAPAVGLAAANHHGKPATKHAAKTHTKTHGTPATRPGPAAPLAAKAKAYGRFCQTESKTHVAGTPGTPFSDCVTDMAKLAHSTKLSARAACANESKKHVAGKRGTPFSICVAGAAKMRDSSRH
jgi:hypothetical protein